MYVIFDIDDSLEHLNKWYKVFNETGMQMKNSSLKKATVIYKSSKPLTLDAMQNFINGQDAYSYEKTKVVFSPLRDFYPSILYGESMQNMFYNYKVCADAHVSSYDLSRCVVANRTDCDIDSDVIYKLTMDNQFIFWINMNKTGLTYYLAKCRLFHLYSNCTSRFYEKRTFKMIHEGKIELLATKKVLDPTEYYPGLNGIYVCNDKVAKLGAKWVENFFKVASAITKAGTCISIISLCVTIYTYVLFKQLMTTPGKNLVSLCVSVLISDIIVLIQTNSTLTNVACKVFGAMLHWSLLACHI